MESTEITPGKGNYFALIRNSPTVKELKSSELRNRCATYIFDIFIVNIFAALTLVAVMLIFIQQKEVYGMLLVNLTILAYFLYYENSPEEPESRKKFVNLIVSSCEGKRDSLERTFLRYFAGGVPGLFLLVIDMAANGVAAVSEHLGFYFIIPLISYVPILFMNLRQGIRDLLKSTVFLKNSAVNEAVNSAVSSAASSAGNEE